MKYPQSQQTLGMNNLLTTYVIQSCCPVLSYLHDSAEETAQITDVIDEIEKETHRDREKISIQLHHSTLPRLEEMGYLDYDQSSGTVRYHGHAL